jgi:hypothetical protein
MFIAPVFYIGGSIKAADHDKSNQSSLKTTEEAKATTPNSVGSVQQRLSWNINTSLEAYNKVGHRSDKWDEAARVALGAFATNRAYQFTGSNWQALSDVLDQNVARAIAAGCDDPMIEYLAGKNVGDPTQRARALVKAAHDMEASQYPDMRKAYACLRASEAMGALIVPTNIAPHTTRYVRSPELLEFHKNCLIHFADALQSKWLPPAEIQEFFFCVMDDPKIWSEEEKAWAWQHIEKPLFENRSSNAVPWLVKGSAYINAAWKARTSKYASEVKDEQWKAFQENLAVARQSLEQAWEIDPKNVRIAEEMLSVEVGLGDDRQRMEMWFKRAMELDPNDMTACQRKAYYLEPKWNGSEQDLLDFGHECVTSTQWGGQVPLIMIDVHNKIAAYLEKSEQPGYWTRPDVWRDIRAAYEKFCRLNPEAKNDPGTVQGYAKYAYRCEQWNTLNELIPKFGEVDYSRFGGKQAYDTMILLAKQHASQPDPGGAR